MPGKKLHIGAEEIAERVRAIGRDISSSAADNLMVVGILNGAFIFAADLVRTITIPLEVDFIRVASYGAETSSSGKIRLIKDLDSPVTGKNVLLVEDIVDTGNTIAWLRKHLQDRGAASIKLCALIDKQERRQQEVKIDYCGFRAQKGFLVGYGLDHSEQYRHLPDIYSLTGY
jgi:hypoxanthine phosphoribosyltransferase